MAGLCLADTLVLYLLSTPGGQVLFLVATLVALLVRRSARPSPKWSDLLQEKTEMLLECPSIAPLLVEASTVEVQAKLAKMLKSFFVRGSTAKCFLTCPLHFGRREVKFKDVKMPVTPPHRAPYLPNGKAYELQTWYTDGGRRSASAAGAMTSKVKVTRSRDRVLQLRPH